MSHYKKLYRKIKNNPRDVRYEDLEKLMIKVGGFDVSTGKGDHVGFTHPDSINPITVDTRGKHKPLKRPAVIECLQAFDEYNPNYDKEE